MSKCNYCNQESPDFKGTFVVDSVSSKVRYYCSSKCRKNAIMTRKKGKWAQTENKEIAKAENK
jgi:ribosomal protein L24E